MLKQNHKKSLVNWGLLENFPQLNFYRHFFHTLYKAVKVH